ncbi:aldehyde dehydrogenase (NADP(+)) [Rhodococcus wratislaviensis]|uniref:Putative aldehyde dehydrogenase n=1 Tax=Rhodococcus wratislaviensis NBRC 100605 TaxID=1219028 RepID=X0QBU0_RHOWR|nr:aldehyde dehydrogenase (NADP(+)) [Rhodococcus wratislaviensis]GAF49042.1 putative aldehyde dehydrogenase [Rhodococcus wratislaviensis NBRC 100605]
MGSTITETASAPTVDEVLARSERAATIWAGRTPRERASVLNALADSLDGAATELVVLAGKETHLDESRLRSELGRTTFQLRFFADVISEGSYLDVSIDHSDKSWGMGPRPDIRRVLEPIGPVVVFAASNFPFAFSVAGGDTASALAAGCPVVVKAHSGHPRLSERTGQIIVDTLARLGAPDGLFAVIFGTDSGREALSDPRVKAGSFTGSIPGGRALFDIANSRPTPIPFYGELGSVNPTFVTRAAAKDRAEQLATEFVGSYTLGAGQFCTKPGMLLVPFDSEISGMLQTAPLPAAKPLLNDRIQSGYVEALAHLQTHGEVEFLTSSVGSDGHPPAPVLLTTTASQVIADPDRLIAEVFGPAALVVEYEQESSLLDLARLLDGQLTATVHGNDDDTIVPELIGVLATKAGRVLWNQWPTGVSVTFAQQHGGPYPATTAPTSTSVGSAAISRFVRPVAYQGFPNHLLPLALQDDNPLHIPRRVNGVR